MIIRSILISVFLFFLVNGCTSGMSETDKVSDKILIQFTKQMKKKDLYAVGLGGGADNNKINLVSVSFDFPQAMNIESARRLIVESTDILLKLINNDSNNKQFFETFPVHINTIYISILGKTPTNNISDYIEVVKIINGDVFYNIENKKERFPIYITVHKETFEEAQKILLQKASF